MCSLFCLTVNILYWVDLCGGNENHIQLLKFITVPEGRAENDKAVCKKSPANGDISCTLAFHLFFLKPSLAGYFFTDICWICFAQNLPDPPHIIKWSSPYWHIFILCKGGGIQKRLNESDTISKFYYDNIILKKP